MSRQQLRELDKVRLQPEDTDGGDDANAEGDEGKANADDATVAAEVVHTHSDSESESELSEVDEDTAEFEVDFIKYAVYTDSRFYREDGYHYGVMWAGYLKTGSDTEEPRSSFLTDPDDPNEKSKTLLEVRKGRDEPGGKLGEKVWPSREYIKEKIRLSKPRRDYQAFWRRKEKVEAGERITKADSDYYIRKKRKAQRAAEKAARSASAEAGPSRPRGTSKPIEAAPSRRRSRSKSGEPKRKRETSADSVPTSRKGKERMPPPPDTTPLKNRSKGKDKARETSGDATPSQTSRAASPAPSFNSLFDEPPGGSQASQASVKERTPKRRRVVESPTPEDAAPNKSEKKAATSKVLSGMGRIAKRDAGPETSEPQSAVNGGSSFELDPDIFGDAPEQRNRRTPLFDFGDGQHDDNDDSMSVDGRKEPTPVKPEPVSAPAPARPTAPEVIDIADSPEAHSEDEVGEILEPGSPPPSATLAPPALTVTSATPVKDANAEQGPASSPSHPPTTTAAPSAPPPIANGELPRKPSDATIASAESAAAAAADVMRSVAAQDTEASRPKPADTQADKPKPLPPSQRGKYKQPTRLVTIDTPIDPTRSVLPPGRLGANFHSPSAPSGPLAARAPANRGHRAAPSPTTRTHPPPFPLVTNHSRPNANGGDRRPGPGPSRGGRPVPDGRSPVARGGMSPNWGTRSPIHGNVSPYNGNVSPRAPTGALSPRAPPHGAMSPVWTGQGAGYPEPPRSAPPIPAGSYEARRDPRRRGPGTASAAPAAAPAPGPQAAQHEGTLCTIKACTSPEAYCLLVLNSGVTSNPGGSFLLQKPPRSTLQFQSADAICLGMLRSQGAKVTEWVRVLADKKSPVWLSMLNQMQRNRVFVCVDELRPAQGPVTSHRLIVLTFTEHAFFDPVGVAGRDVSSLGSVILLVDVPFDGPPLASIPNPVRPAFNKTDDRDKEAAEMVPASNTIETYGFNEQTIARNSTIYIMPSAYNKCQVYDEMVEICKKNNVKPAGPDKPPESVFILNGRFPDVTRSSTVRRCLDHNTRFWSLGHDVSSPIQQWSMRPVWETGGLVTFSPTFILRNHEQMTDIIDVIRTTPNWATYIIPSTMLYFDANYKSMPEPWRAYAALTSALFMDDNLLKLAGSLASDEGGMAVSYTPPPMPWRQNVAEWMDWLARVFECTKYDDLVELCRVPGNNAVKSLSLSDVEQASLNDLISMRCRPHTVPYRRFLYIGGVSRPDIKQEAKTRGVEFVSADDFEAVLQGSV